MTSRTRLLVLLVTTPLVAFVLVGGFLGARAQMPEPTTAQSLRVFEDVIRLINEAYVEDVDLEKVLDGAMRGLADGLDSSSAFLPPAQVQAIEKGERLPEGDVGLDLTRQYYLRVVAARDGSPAARAGLQPGDFVRAIDGRPTRDISVYEGARLLRGAPGTKVSLLVIRGNAADPHVVELTRERPAELPVTGRLLETADTSPRVGYIRVPAFGDGTAAALRRQVSELAAAGATGLVIDLRRTTEGALETGFKGAEVFLERGRTLGLKSVRDRENAPVTSQGEAEPVRLPLVVLTNYGTAGAAEVFAAALAGNGRAKLVGERTNGRTGLQKLIKLPEGGLWLTYATYTTPKGEAIHEKGLTPAVEVEEPEVEFGKTADPAAKDPLIEKAVEILTA